MSIVKRSSRLRARPESSTKIGKSERTRAAILDAALDFIWSHPFREMTVNSLMASTEVTRATFYQYFSDLHELMECLLVMLQDEIFVAVSPWIVGTGDPVVLMNETLAGLVRVCYRRGPFLRAISDAATTDERFEKSWKHFLGGFDDAGCARIEADQAQGLIPDFDARPIATALNRLNAYTIIEAFGRRPRRQPEPIRKALVRVWSSTLYGNEWLGMESSNLVRT
jgi:AcrR family transcriptional regulator